MMVRDSKQPTGPVLITSPVQRSAFVEAVSRASSTDLHGRLRGQALGDDESLALITELAQRAE
jgi:hypothetical protein